MAIQKLNIKGFRSLRDITWEPGPLNLLIGPNASGKSNLIRALTLLKKAAQGELPQEILRMGGMAPLLWDGQTQELHWSLKTEPGFGAQGAVRRPGAPQVDSSGDDPSRPREPLTYALTLRQLGMTSAYRIDHELLGTFEPREPGQTPALKKLLERRPGQAVTFDLQDRSTIAHEGSVPDDQTLLSLISGPFGNPHAIDFHSMLAGWSIYHDVRVDQEAPLRQPAVTRMEQRVAPDGQNLIPVLHTLYTSSRDFKNTLDEAMRAAFGSDYEELLFPPAADQRVQLRIRWRSLRTEQSASNLSDGTLRFLLLCAILASPDTGALIAVDEPEAGLHPGMLPIVAELAADAAERTQVIFTTHSPQLLDAFTDKPATTTVTRWDDGETHLSIVNGEELQRWLKEYSLGALFRSGELEGMA